MFDPSDKKSVARTERQIRERNEWVRLVAGSLADADGKISLVDLAEETGLDQSLLAHIRLRFRRLGLWTWGDGRTSMLWFQSDLAAPTPEVRDAVNQSKIDVRLDAIGHLAHDDRDDDPRDAIGCVGFGHAPPILGGSTSRYCFGQGSRDWKSINDPILSLTCREACRLMIAEARRKGWIGRRASNHDDKQQVA